MYEAKIILDSISPAGNRLTTVQITFPRIVLAEVVTHRLLYETTRGEVEYTCTARTATRELSKNSSSSRAIPSWRLAEQVLEDPYVPTPFTKNCKGMQAKERLAAHESHEAECVWVEMVQANVEACGQLHNLGVHKQQANRLIEPFAWVTQLLTATQDGWANFFHQRCHQDCQPEFRKVARMLYLKYRDSKPAEVCLGGWHLPFITDSLIVATRSFATEYDVQKLKNVSAGMCAWVSYQPPGEVALPAKDLMEKALNTCDKLMGDSPYGRTSGPLHASPFEHQATPAASAAEAARYRSNLTGWVQRRKMMNGEFITEYKPSESEIACWEES